MSCELTEPRAPHCAEPAAIHIRRLGLVDFEPTWRAMQAYTTTRTAQTADEIWLLEHHPVYTLGQAGRPEHVLRATTIPVLKTDRGGQVTYHGPGQLVAYLLLDLRRRNLKVRGLVSLMEQAIIEFLDDAGVTAVRRIGAPGVYVGEAKIAALGLRVKNGCSYHGLALNVAMDLAPYGAINPCGHAGMPVTQLSALRAGYDLEASGELLLAKLQSLLENEGIERK